MGKKNTTSCYLVFPASLCLKKSERIVEPGKGGSYQVKGEDAVVR